MIDLLTHLLHNDHGGARLRQGDVAQGEASVSCPSCNRWNSDGKLCLQVRCLACGTEQCHLNGASKGACKHCSYGMLPGWSGNNNPDQPGHYPSSSFRNDVLCQYKGCTEPAVYTALPGAKDKACKVHGDAVIERERTKAAERTKRRRW